MHIYIYIYKLHSEYEDKLGTSLFSHVVSAAAIFKGIYSHLKDISGYRRFLYDVVCLEILHNGVAFFLTAVDQN